MSKLSDFLEKEKIDPRRILSVSAKLEGLRREDRKIRLARRVARSGNEASDAVKELAAKKPRSGRSVSRPTLDRALRGEKVSPGARRRIGRAVNYIRQQRKQDPIATPELF